MHEHIPSTVGEGEKMGRTLGFPTINCSVSTELFSGEAGTYRVNVLIAGTIYKGIGPWFPERRLFEVHLLDTEKDFYHQEVVIIPLVKIRDNKKFNSLEELKKQIQRDLAWAENHPQVVITFGTFDYLHPGHESYLSQAKQHGDYLVTVIARDETVKRIKGSAPDHHEDERLVALSELEIIDIAELGNSQDHYTCLREYTPQVICLGYDQHSFDTGLRAWCDANGLKNTHIIRLESSNPEQRKSSLIKQQQTR